MATRAAASVLALLCPAMSQQSENFPGLQQGPAGRHTAPRAQFQGIRQNKGYGKLWGDWCVLPGVSAHHPFQREDLKSQCYLPQTSQGRIFFFFFMVIIKITCPTSSRNTESLVSSLFLPCDWDFWVTTKRQLPVPAFSDTVFPSCQEILWCHIFWAVDWSFPSSDAQRLLPSQLLECSWSPSPVAQLN